MHQHQRPVQRVERAGEVVEYVEVTPADIETANRLADEVLGRSLDELAPQSRTLLGRLEAMVAEISEAEAIEPDQVKPVRFTRKDVRAYTGWSDFQVRTHLGKLESLEYVLAHRGGPGSRYSYELLYRGEGTDGGRFLMGLIDTATLRAAYGSEPENREGSEVNPEGSDTRLRAPVEGGVRGGKKNQKLFSSNGSKKNSETARSRTSGPATARRVHTRTGPRSASSNGRRP